MFPIALGPREIVDELLSVDATWKTFESELEAAVHLESVSSVTMARVEPWRSQYANEGYCELGWMSFRISFRMFFFWGGGMGFRFTNKLNRWKITACALFLALENEGVIHYDPVIVKPHPLDWNLLEANKHLQTAKRKCSKQS